MKRVFGDRQELPMETALGVGSSGFRVWLATYDEYWRPEAWHELPPVATAFEPAADRLYNEAEAGAFVEGFNRSMLAEPRQLWAVAVPVTVRLDGDAHPGLPICGHQFIIREGEAPAEPDVLSGEATQVKRRDAETYPSADVVQGFVQSPQRSR
jgi:hypothetical protein